MTILSLLEPYFWGRNLKRTRKDTVAPMLQLKTEEWKMLSARMLRSVAKASGDLSPIPFGSCSQALTTVPPPSRHCTPNRSPFVSYALLRRRRCFQCFRCSSIKHRITSHLFGVRKRVVSKRVDLADVPRYPKPERGYMRMIPGKIRNEGTCGCSPVPKSGTRAHFAKKPPFCKTALLFLLESLMLLATSSKSLLPLSSLHLRTISTTHGYTGFTRGELCKPAILFKLVLALRWDCCSQPHT